jgi:hypothetical protein
MSDQASESAIAFDPPFGIDPVSYREWHAAVDGFYCGVRDRLAPDEEEYGKEKHYWRIGWLIGDAYDRWVRR